MPSFTVSILKSALLTTTLFIIKSPVSCLIMFSSLGGEFPFSFFFAISTLSSHHQDIVLPDSRHRLSFKDFKINLKNRLVEFDSCTIAATRTDSSTSAFNVFFDKLLLTNIDFDTLYKAEVIKADLG